LLKVDRIKNQWKVHITFSYKEAAAIDGSKSISLSAHNTPPHLSTAPKARSAMAVSTVSKTSSQKKRSPGLQSGARRTKPVKKGAAKNA
jgi:hypothetical protein